MLEKTKEKIMREGREERTADRKFEMLEMRGEIRKKDRKKGKEKGEIQRSAVSYVSLFFSSKAASIDVKAIFSDIMTHYGCFVYIFMPN